MGYKIPFMRTLSKHNTRIRRVRSRLNRRNRNNQQARDVPADINVGTRMIISTLTAVILFGTIYIIFKYSLRKN